MLRPSGNSPTQRGVPDVPERIARLEAFERWRTPSRIDFEAIVGTAAYAAYWAEMDRVIAELESSQKLADGLRHTIAEAADAWQIRPQVGDPKASNDGCTG